MFCPLLTVKLEVCCAKFRCTTYAGLYSVGACRNCDIRKTQCLVIFNVIVYLKRYLKDEYIFYNNISSHFVSLCLILNYGIILNLKGLNLNSIPLGVFVMSVGKIIAEWTIFHLIIGNVTLTKCQIWLNMNDLQNMLGSGVYWI